MGTQYISASKSLGAASVNRALYGTPSQIIAEIDLSKVSGSVVDLTGACTPLKGVTAKNRAEISQEILIVGHVSASAIKVIR